LSKKLVNWYLDQQYEVQDGGYVWRHPLVHPSMLVYSDEDIYSNLLSESDTVPSWEAAQELLAYARSLIYGDVEDFSDEYSVSLGGLGAIPADRRNFYKKQAAKTFGADIDADQIVALVEAADPTPKGKYMQWVIQQWHQKEFILPEDTDGVREVLLAFDDLVKRDGYTGERNIFNISYTELRRGLLESLKASAPKTHREKQEAQIAEGAKVVYDDGKHTIVEVTTPEASVYYSQLAAKVVQEESGLSFEAAKKKGFIWCTHHIDCARRYLPNYILFFDGRIAVQFQPDTTQLMDTFNNPVNNPEIIKLLANFFWQD
jgi:hypothetical protein